MSPIFEANTFDFISTSAQQTRRLGARLGRLLQPGDIICLRGELGAGKTQMAAGIAAGWGAAEAVSSPTFVLVHAHTRPEDATRLYHVDGYRIEGPGELATIGWEDMLAAEAVLVIEWPERIREALPASYIWVTLDYIEDDAAFTRRHLLFEAEGKRHQDVLLEFRRRAFGVMPD